MELRIDPEFKGKIPPLTPEEYRQLEENILADGRVKEPLTVWNGIIVDGHNRWRIIKDHPEIPYRVEERAFADKWEAFEWMYKNQLGRRNLTDENRAYCRGKMYEARKHRRGAEPGGRGNQHSKVVNDQSDRLPETADLIAKELGVGSATVKRSEKFAHGIDAIREEAPELADKILAGGSGVTMKDVRAVGKAKPEDRPRMIEQIKRGERVTAADIPDKIVPTVETDYNGGGTKEYREQRKAIAQKAAQMLAPPPETTLGDVLDDISMNGVHYLGLMRGILNQHSAIIAGNREIVKEAIGKIENELRKMKEEV